MHDLISREMLIHSLCSYDEKPAKFCVPCREVCEIVKSIPSIPIWVPCSEMLPEEDGDYLASTDYGWVYVIRWADGWNCYRELPDGEVCRDKELDCVVAWMPLPEPYKEAKE